MVLHLWRRVRPTFLRVTALLLPSWKYLITTDVCRRCISFHAIIFDEIYPIFAASARHHGLQFTSSNIAASLSIMGPVICVAQLVLYPMLHNRFSPLALWRASAAIFMVVYPLFSLLPHISRSDHGPSRVLQWVGVIFLLTIRFIANVVAYTSISVLVRHRGRLVLGPQSSIRLPLLLTSVTDEPGRGTREARSDDGVRLRALSRVNSAFRCLVF